MTKLLLIILLAGCAVSPKRTVYNNVDSRALKLVDKFQLLYKKDLPENLVVEFRKLKKNHVGGFCYMKKNYVVINTKFWKRASDLSKESVVFHELGHCVLDRGHVVYDDKKWSCSPSLMGWRGATDRCYRQHYDYYINELFTGCRKFKGDRK